MPMDHQITIDIKAILNFYVNCVQNLALSQSSVWNQI